MIACSVPELLGHPFCLPGRCQSSLRIAQRLSHLRDGDVPPHEDLDVSRPAGELNAFGQVARRSVQVVPLVEKLAPPDAHAPHGWQLLAAMLGRIPEGALQNVVRFAEVTLRQFQVGVGRHRAKRDVIVAGGSAQSPRLGVGGDRRLSVAGGLVSLRQSNGSEGTRVQVVFGQEVESPPSMLDGAVWISL